MKLQSMISRVMQGQVFGRSRAGRYAGWVLSMGILTGILYLLAR